MCHSASYLNAKCTFLRSIHMLVLSMKMRLQNNSLNKLMKVINAKQAQSPTYSLGIPPPPPYLVKKAFCLAREFISLYFYPVFIMILP